MNQRSTGKKIVVAMSGGVDSSLAAALLKREGHDIIGITFRMWPKEECGSAVGRTCCSLEAVTRARAVAEQLKIPYYVVDFSDQFKKDVIDYFCAQYLEGLTPNPCVICNQKIKFGKLAEKARSLGASSVATGHYVRGGIDGKTGRYLLIEGKDKPREQSYFLFALSQDQLARSIFPLGDLTKERTRQLAKELKIPSYDTVSSQDVCFTQGIDYAEYIQKKTGVKITGGDIVDSSGKIIGRHRGIPCYTIGQRRGLGIAHKEPLYVTALDIEMNRIIVGPKTDALKRSLIAENVNWISVAGIDGPITVKAKIRYNHKKAAATVTKMDEGSVKVDFERPQEAPAPGQAVVFYDKETVVGGGWIKKVLC